jgi:hypothetical protein
MCARPLFSISISSPRTSGLRISQANKNVRIQTICAHQAAGVDAVAAVVQPLADICTVAQAHPHHADAALHTAALVSRLRNTRGPLASAVAHRAEERRRLVALPADH